MAATDKGNTANPSSIKELFQGMTPEGANVIQGTVISASPLKIQAVNDEKLILPEGVLIVPRHLTDYTTTCDISLGQGAINSVTQSGQGTHPHGSSGTHGGHSSGDGSHSHPSGEGAHVHNVATFNISGASITVHNALQSGERVHLLSFNNGKKYYILDRVR